MPISLLRGGPSKNYSCRFTVMLYTDSGPAVARLVEALIHKTGGPGLDSRWGP